MTTPSQHRNAITARDVALVAAGGAVGTLTRAALTEVSGEAGGLPIGIFVANISGAFLLGLLLQTLGSAVAGRLRRLRLLLGTSRRLRLLVGTGVLGGYTTYSALTVDAAQLVLDERLQAAIGYAVGSVVLGVLASWAGILLARTWTARR